MPVAPDVSVVTSGHDVADARLHRQVAALHTVGLTVEVLGLGSAEHGPPGASVRTWPRVGGWRRAALAWTLAARARGRVVVTLDPDSAVAAAGVRNLRRVRSLGRGPGRGRGRGLGLGRSPVRLVADVHEDFADLLRDRSWARGPRAVAARGLVALFVRVASRADLTVVADEHVPPLSARHRIVVRNDPDLSLLPEPSPADEAPRAVYIGDLRATRGLFAMLEALRSAPGWRLDLVGPVAPSDEERLAATLAADLDLAGRVRLHGRLPPRQAWRVAAGAWTGLLLLADTPAFRRAEPSKLAEYLACGLPVVTTDLPRQAAVVRTAGAGAVVPVGPDRTVGEQVAAVLTGWSTEPATWQLLQLAARTEADRRQRRPSGYHALAEVIVRLV